MPVPVVKMPRGTSATFSERLPLWISSRGRSPAAVIASVLPYDDSSTDEASSSVQQQQQNRKLTAQQGGTKNGVGATEQQRDTVITINVSGMRFQAYESTLRRFPNSLLGDPMKRQFYWNDELQEIFLDRSRSCFEAILHIYRHFGQVVRPVTVPVELFIDELIFYELKEDVWANFCESEGCRIRPAEKEPENALQRIIWHLMEHPDSSPFARLLAAISVTVILISTVSFCLESIPELKPADETREWSSPFFWIEFSCCLWFSIGNFELFNIIFKNSFCYNNISLPHPELAIRFLVSATNKCPVRIECL